MTFLKFSFCTLVFWNTHAIYSSPVKETLGALWFCNCVVWCHVVVEIQTLYSVAIVLLFFSRSQYLWNPWPKNVKLPKFVPTQRGSTSWRWAARGSCTPGAQEMVENWDMVTQGEQYTLYIHLLYNSLYTSVQSYRWYSTGRSSRV